MHIGHHRLFKAACKNMFDEGTANGILALYRQKANKNRVVRESFAKNLLCAALQSAYPEMDLGAAVLVVDRNIERVMASSVAATKPEEPKKITGADLWRPFRLKIVKSMAQYRRGDQSNRSR